MVSNFLTEIARNQSPKRPSWKVIENYPPKQIAALPYYVSDSKSILKPSVQSSVSRESMICRELQTLWKNHATKQRHRDHERFLLKRSWSKGFDLHAVCQIHRRGKDHAIARQGGAHLDIAPLSASSSSLRN